MKIKKLALLVMMGIMFGSSVMLTGCWDGRELDHLYIVTGIGIDKTDTDLIDLSIQVGKTQQTQSQSSTGGGQSFADSKKYMVLNTQFTTVNGGISKIISSSSRSLLLDHTQVLVFGEDIAKESILPHLDFFIRSQESRIEVPVFVFQGKAKDFLDAQIEQEGISGVFLAKAIDDRSKISKLTKVKVFDAMQTLLSEKTALLLPYVRLVEGISGKPEIEITGYAVFQEGKMIGDLDLEETKGFIITMAPSRNYNMFIKESEDDTVSFSVTKTNCKPDIKVNEDNTVDVTFSVEGTFSIGQIKGFKDLEPDKLLKKLDMLANQILTQTVQKAIIKAKEYNADFFGIGNKIYKKQPKLWQENLYQNWEQIFPNINYKIESNIKVIATGDVVQSLEMEQGKMEMERANAN